MWSISVPNTLALNPTTILSDQTINDVIIKEPMAALFFLRPRAVFTNIPSLSPVLYTIINHQFLTIL